MKNTKIQREFFLTLVLFIALFYGSASLTVLAEEEKNPPTDGEAAAVAEKEPTAPAADKDAAVAEGEQLYDKGDFDAARAKLEAFIEAEPNSPSQRKANHLLALSYYGAGDTRRAIDIWERMLSEDKSGALGFRISYNLALAYTRLGDVKKTYECLAKIPMEVVMEQDAVGRRAYVELAAQTAAGMGQHEAAVLSYVSGLSLLSDSTSREALLGEIVVAAKQLKTRESVEGVAGKISDEEAKRRVLASMDDNPNLKNAEPPKEEAPKPAGETKPVTDEDKIFRVTPGLGLTQLSYSQTGLSSLSVTALSFSAAGHLKLDANWRVVGDGLIYLVPVRVRGNDTGTRLLRLAGGGGYDFNINDSWTSRVALTYEYGSLLTPDKEYGFQNLSGPQVFFSGDYQINAGQKIGGRVYGSLYNNDTKLLTTNNNKLGLGIKYTVKYSDELPPLNVGLDFTNYTLNFTDSSAKGQTFDLMFSSDFDFAL